MQEEAWKPVPIAGFENKYDISNLGRIRTKQRRPQVCAPRARSKYGYLKVNLANGKVRKLRAIHQLVALAFIPNPQGLPCVNHKDNDPSNNYVENLEWIGFVENRMYTVKQNRHAKGSMVGSAKLTEANVLEIRRSTLSSVQLANQYGVSSTAVQYARARKSWRHI